jgi:hypothetical protein
MKCNECKVEAAEGGAITCVADILDVVEAQNVDRKRSQANISLNGTKLPTYGESVE